MKMDITKSLLSNSEYKRLIEINEKYDSAHDLAHFLRVKRYSIYIGREEKADLEILEAASMLHDIARGLEAKDEISDHLKTGAEISKEILKEIKFIQQKIDDVCYAVSVHQRRKGIIPMTLESKILQDADLLDTYGLIYVARSILFGVQSDKYKRPLFIDKSIEDYDYIRDKNLSTIHYLMHRIKNPELAPSSLHTKVAQDIAKKRFKYIKEFVDEFVKEWRGEI